ncbi:hypothetical protein [Burkholderia cenocepacia]|uniref:hypothetical protein n=1 Tax=Burkholderia cenocepacia TaxID=95486 RepID=UPI001B8EEC56|nr:hypothetical protein [Burkholderia cenocepacia]MBR8494705.1 hypothetical protein [Burkholderia cenocepacia]
MTDLALLAHDSLALARGAEHRSKMARFREMFEYVCAAIDAGVRHLAIRDLLAKHGLDLSVATLDVMISRVRRERNLPLPRDARRAAARPVAPPHVPFRTAGPGAGIGGRRRTRYRSAAASWAGPIHQGIGRGRSTAEGRASRRLADERDAYSRTAALSDAGATRGATAGTKGTVFPESAARPIS